MYCLLNGTKGLRLFIILINGDKTQETTVNISIYGQLVDTRGYDSRLIFNKTSHSQREYRVCVTNNYGKVCKDIRHADDDEGIPIQYLF